MHISVKKGHTLNIVGQPGSEIEQLGKPPKIGVLPERIPFIKPRLRVGVGDRVSIGSPLFEDKRNPEIIFCSPGAGSIAAVNYGKRRAIQEIVIHLDEEETEETFRSLSENELNSVDRETLVGLILCGGLWPLIRQLPFRDIASYETPPPSIIVSLDSLDCFMPPAEFYLADNEDLFLFGLKILKRLSEAVHVAGIKGMTLPDKIKQAVTHTVSGNYPADDPGALLYHIRKTPDDNPACYISGQDLLLLATLIRDGRYPTERLFAVGGSQVGLQRFVKGRIGAPALQLAGPPSETGKKVRFASGGILRGYKLPVYSFMGLFETGLTILPEGDEEVFFGFVRPGYNRQSYSRTFLSFFNRSKIDMNCSTYGEVRACINCGTCEKVCPVDIFPQFAFKSIDADEIEEALVHGLLDCVECGLCTYVCPAKIDISQKLKTAKAVYYKERA